MRARTGWAAAGLLQAALVAAQPADAGGAEGPQLDTITVTGRRSLEDRFFAAGSLVVVDRRDIEQLGAFSVADVLRQLPGVVVTTSGDGSVEIRMRGMDRNATQILVDGQRVANGRSQLALDQLPPEMLERIEVLRAPSAEFAGATGGTINIVLRQATVKRETVVRLTDNRVWGHNAAQAFFSRTGPVGETSATPAPSEVKADPSQPWSYFVAASHTGVLLGSDARRQVLEPALATETEASTRHRRREISLIPRLNGRLGAQDQLGLRGTLTRARVEGHYDATGSTTGPSGSKAFASSEQSRFTRHYLQGAADWTHRFQESKLETSLAASEAREDVDRSGGTSALPSGAPLAAYVVDDQRRESLRSLHTKWSGTSSALLWMMGAQAERRAISVESFASGVPAQVDAELERRVLWGQNEWEVFDGSTLTAGLRGEMLRITSTSPALLLAQRRMNFLQPSLHLRMPLSGELQFRANLARITRQPRIWDLLDRTVTSTGGNSLANPDTVGNPALRPEVSWTLDTGFERRLAQGGQAGANLFVRRTSDTIAGVTNFVAGRWTEQRMNVGGALVWGLELDVKTGLGWIGLARDWTLSAHGSLLQSRMMGGINDGARIPGQPRYTASVTVARPLRRSGGLFGGGTLTLTGSSDLATSPGITGRERSRAALDLYVGSVVRGLGYWRVGVYNITDAPYARSRSYADGSGAVAASSNRFTLTPRLYLTVGTQF